MAALSRARSHTGSRAGSPVHSSVADSLRSPSITDFQIERVKSSSKRRSLAVSDRNYEETLAFRDLASRFIAAKNRPFSVSGRVPLDSSQLVLFFRSKSRITHSLDFPIDVDYNSPPALDVLIAACLPHQFDDAYLDRSESLFYPPNLPLSASLDIANHPILDAVRTALFPLLPPDQHLTAVRDKLEVVLAGGRMGVQPPSMRNDGRCATIIVTLPVRFRGGALLVRDPREPPEREEKYSGRSGKSGDIEWTAFLPEAEYEVEIVQRGCRMSISYAVFIRSFDPAVGPEALDPLIHPSDKLLDTLAPILNMSRGKKIGFYLTQDYTVDPAEAFADSVVPLLKSGDSLLYHCLLLYKLTPEFHWTAGGYIWPVDRVVDVLSEDQDIPTTPHQHHQTPAALRRRSRHDLDRKGRSTSVGRASVRSQSVHGQRVGVPGDVPPMRGPFATSYQGSDSGSSDKTDHLRTRVEDSGAISLTEANVTILLDWNDGGPANQIVGKERVYFVSGGEMEKLVVNVLLVTYVP